MSYPDDALDRILAAIRADADFEKPAVRKYIRDEVGLPETRDGSFFRLGERLIFVQSADGFYQYRPYAVVDSTRLEDATVIHPDKILYDGTLVDVTKPPRGRISKLHPYAGNLGPTDPIESEALLLRRLPKDLNDEQVEEAFEPDRYLAVCSCNDEARGTAVDIAAWIDEHIDMHKSLEDFDTSRARTVYIADLPPAGEKNPVRLKYNVDEGWDEVDFENECYVSSLKNHDEPPSRSKRWRAAARKAFEGLRARVGGDV